MSTPIGLTIKNNIYDMSIGDCIPFRYTATVSGSMGHFNELGTCNMTEIPITGSATPDGLAYFIKVDRGLLICDRIIQHSITWNTLNNNGYIEGNRDSRHITNNISVGTTPYEIWGDSTHVYVCNSGNNNVTCINRSNNSKTTITVGAEPQAIWGDSTHVYVCNYDSNNVTCIDRSNNSTTTIAVGVRPNKIWGDSNNVYICNGGGNNVTCINRPSNSTTSIALSGGYPFNIWGDSTQVYVCDGNNIHNVVCINRSNNSTTNIPVTYNPNAIWGDSTYIYAATSAGTVVCINRSNNSKTVISVGSSPRAIWGDSTHVYTCNYGSNNVTCINRSNNSKTTITTGANPYDIWGDSNYVYTCNYTGNNVTCIDRSNNKTTNITVGTNPYGIWGDSNNIYVNNVNSNNVTCITRPKYNPYIIRSLNGGNAYLGADGKSSLNDQFLGGCPSINEWDKYIVKSDLGGKITPGDDNIWHWSNLISWCQDTILTGMTRKFDGLTSIDSSMRMHRGLNSTTAIIDLTTPSYSHSVYVGNNVGLRPVLQYVEPGSKQTNLYY